jgi:NAD(P)-dependent dehydrogenase (short-subunit alcohol dehydrogenase family)
MAVEQLSGRVAVVTGAASGIGLAMARRFAAEDMRVVLSDLEPGPLEQATAELRDGGHDVRGVVADVSRWEDVEALAEATIDAFDAVHVVCNNAGVTTRGWAWELTLDDWRWVLGVDLWGVIHGVRAFVPRLLEQGEGGHVVNTASMTGVLPIRGLAGYSVAKTGVVALSEVMALDLEAVGASVGVSVLLPGFIATRITESDRNRPEHLGERAAGSGGPHTTTGAESTMSADEVAGLVVDAVRTGEFWILTHPDYRAVIQQRAAGIGDGGRPFQPPIW